MENDQTLEQAILEQLQTPLLDKKDPTKLQRDENGNIMMPVKVMAMSIINQAMHGSIPHANYVRNFMKEHDPDESARRSEEYRQKLDDAIQFIIDDLTKEGLYAEQLVEIEQLAKTKLIIDRLEEEMMQPDYEDIITEQLNNGTTRRSINPLHDRWDKMQKQFLSDLKALRLDAMRRKSNIKRKK